MKVNLTSSSINVSYVGHPLPYKINLNENDIKNKKENSIALLPGSRKSEISLIGNLMVKTARELKEENPALTFFMPLASKSHLSLFTEDMDDLITVSYGDSQDILRKSRLAIITSGTATLESILSFTPCVALYKTNWLSYLIIKPLLQIDSFSLPNLIKGQKILPELLQAEVTINNIVNSVKEIKEKEFSFYLKEFNQIKEILKAGGAEKASKEILQLLN